MDEDNKKRFASDYNSRKPLYRLQEKYGLTPKASYMLIGELSGKGLITIDRRSNIRAPGIYHVDKDGKLRLDGKAYGLRPGDLFTVKHTDDPQNPLHIFPVGKNQGSGGTDEAPTLAGRENVDKAIHDALLDGVCMNRGTAMPTTEIARQAGYAPSTIATHSKAMIERGELMTELRFWPDPMKKTNMQARYYWLPEHKT